MKELQILVQVIIGSNLTLTLLTLKKNARSKVKGVCLPSLQNITSNSRSGFRTQKDICVHVTHNLCRKLYQIYSHKLESIFYLVLG